MKRTNDEPNDAQNNDDADGELPVKADKDPRDREVDWHSGVSRRQVLAGAAAAGASAAALSTGATAPVAASHNTTDPLADDGTATPTSDGGGGIDPTDGAVVGAAMGLWAAPLTVTSGAALGAGGEVALDKAGDWLFGVFDTDNQDLQLEVSSYQHLKTVAQTQEMLHDQHYNQEQLVEAPVLSNARYKSVRRINAGETEAEVQAAARDSALTQLTPYEGNYAALIDTAILKSLEVAEQQRADGWSESELTVGYKQGSGDNDPTWYPVGVTAIHIELLDGSTHNGWAMELEDPNQSGTWVWHPWLTGAGSVAIGESTLGARVEEYADNTLQDTYDSVKAGGRWVTRVDELDSDNPSFTVGPNDLIDGLYSDGTISNNSFDGYIRDVIYARADALVTDAEATASTLYDGIKSGEIDTSEALGPQQWADELTQDYMETGNTGYAKGLAYQLGLDTVISSDMTIDVKQTGASEVDYTVDGGIATNWRPGQYFADINPFSSSLTVDSTDYPLDVFSREFEEHDDGSTTTDTTTSTSDYPDVPTSASVNVGTSYSDVTAVDATLGDGSTVALTDAGVSDGSQYTVDVSALGSAGTTVSIDQITVTYNDGSGTSQTQQYAPSITINIIEDPIGDDGTPTQGDFKVGHWYDVSNSAHGESVMVFGTRQSNGKHVFKEVTDSESFRISEAIDGDGNSQDWVSLTDKNDPQDLSNVSEDIAAYMQELIEAQTEVSEQTAGAGGTGDGDAGGGGGSLAVLGGAAAIAGGAYLYAKGAVDGLSGGGGRSK